MFTKEMALTAVTRFGNALEYLPIDLKDFDVCETSVTYHISSVKFVPSDLNKVAKIYKIALQADGTTIRYIPQTARNVQLALEDWKALPHIKNPTPELYALAVFNDSRALAYVPKKQQTLMMCARVLLDNAKIANDPKIMEHIKLRGESDLETLLAIRGMFLGYLETKYRTFQICSIAVAENPHAVEYVPEFMDCSYQKRDGLYMTAINANPWVLKCIRHQNLEMCMAAVKKDGLTLVHVHRQTEGICKAAVAQSPAAAALIRPGVMPVPAPKTVALEPVAETAAASEPVVIASESIVAAFEPVVISPESIVAAFEPVVISPESIVAAFEPVVISPESIVVAFEPVAETAATSKTVAETGIIRICHEGRPGYFVPVFPAVHHPDTLLQ